MKKSKIIAVPAAAAALSFAVSAFAYEEIMNRTPLVYPKVQKFVAAKTEKKMPASPKPATEGSEKLNANLEWFGNTQGEELSVVNPDGERLQGYYYPAEKESDVFVVCFHGFTSSAFGDYSSKTKFWHDEGYNVVILDQRCHGKSEGKWITFGYKECRDGLVWLQFLISRFGSGIKFILHGISMGSATVMMMSGDDALPSNTVGTVADCGYSSWRDELKYMMNKVVHLPDFPLLYTGDIFNRIVNGFFFGDVSPLEKIKKARVPVLFIHGANDPFVPPFMAHQLYTACPRTDKEILIVEGAGHTESHKTDTIGYEKKATGFAKRCLGK